MRLIIAGSRTVYPSIEQIDAEFDDFLFVLQDVAEVVSGTASGADDAGESWAATKSIPVRRFPANWDKYGKAAGKFRNREMADYADMALVFWDGMSSGAADMATRMLARDKPVRVVPCKRRAR